jgi:hypothetical protein
MKAAPSWCLAFMASFSVLHLATFGNPFTLETASPLDTETATAKGNKKGHEDPALLAGGPSWPIT